MRRWIPLLLLLIGAAPAAPQITVVDIENRTYSCRELSFQPPNNLSFTDLSGRPLNLLCDQIAEITWPKDSTRPPAGLVRFQFTSGDLWTGEIAEGTPDGARIKSPDLGLIEVRFERLDRILFPGGESAVPADQKAEADDIVWKRNKDSDRGSIISLDAFGLAFKSSLFGKDVVTPIADLMAVQLCAQDAPPVPEGLYAILSGHRGTRLAGTLAGISRTHVVLQPLYEGAEPISVPVGCVASLYFKNGRVVYLSDLHPEKIVERPFFEVASDQIGATDYLFPWRRDQAVSGGRLSVEGREYRKGLGVHAYSELHFALGGRFERFLAVAGIDDSAAPTELAQPSVAFSVLVDGKKIWESGPVLWNSPESQVSVPVKGAQTLTLVVDFAGDGDSLDRADWAAARLVR